MDYAEAALFFPMYSPQQKMEAYAILGGMPLYLEQFDPQQGIEQNVIGTNLQSHTFLSEEPEWLLLEEFRRDLLYSSILRAVAVGHRRPSDIAKAIGKGSAQDIAVALDKLQQLGLIVREVPVTERSLPRSRRSLYYLADEYLHLWYRCGCNSWRKRKAKSFCRWTCSRCTNHKILAPCAGLETCTLVVNSHLH
jgi:hypothetical protein